MPHYRCEPCRTRLHVRGKPPELVGHLCPECGSLLEPADTAGELVGYRAITSRDGTAAAPVSGIRGLIAAFLDESVARQPSIDVQDRLEAERWLDERDELWAAAAQATPGAERQLGSPSRRAPR